MEAAELIRRVASRLLAMDVIFRGVQRTLMRSLDARRALERNIERVLAGANLPSARDVDRILAQVRELDSDLGDLTSRLEALAIELRAPRPPSPAQPARDPSDTSV